MSGWTTTAGTASEGTPTGGTWSAGMPVGRTRADERSSGSTAGSSSRTRRVVHWSDHGLTVGDGVFETIELRQGRPFALTRHLERLARSARGLGVSAPDEDHLRAAIADVVDAWGDEPGRLRVTCTAGPGPMGSQRSDTDPTLLVVAGPGSIRRDPTEVVVVDWTRNERGALVGLKTTSYAENVVALAAATEAGASEAVFANTRGELCEGTGSNVFVALEGRLVTPPLSSGCLAGITRELLLEALATSGAPAQELDLPLAALGLADEAFLVSTTRHVQPIAAVDGRALPAAPGPLTRAAAAVWDEAYAERLDP